MNERIKHFIFFIRFPVPRLLLTIFHVCIILFTISSPFSPIFQLYHSPVSHKFLLDPPQVQSFSVLDHQILQLDPTQLQTSHVLDIHILQLRPRHLARLRSCLVLDLRTLQLDPTHLRSFPFLTFSYGQEQLLRPFLPLTFSYGQEQLRSFLFLTFSYGPAMYFCSWTRLSYRVMPHSP